MLEIITASGVSLDLDPETEFEIEMENPMLSDSHIPVAYSTSIAFTPTAKNKKVFGYLSAMYRDPDIKELSVTIHANGIPLFWGILEFESIEHGKLNYTFAGKNLEDKWGGYIHNLSHLSNFSIGRNNKHIQQFANSLKNIQQGNEAYIEDFELPMLVGEENITDVEYSKNDIGAEKAEYKVKYHNYYWLPIMSVISPAVKVSNILSEAFKEVAISEEMTTLYNALAILGLHRSKQLSPLYGMQQEDSGRLLLDIADSLPECTIIDLVTNITKIFCATIFREGSSLVLKTNREVLASSTTLDWTDKVSDEYSLSQEAESSYSFGFSNDESENTYTTESESTPSADGHGTIADVDSMLGVIDAVTKSTDYIAVRNLTTGDMYSGKQMTITTGNDKKFTLPYMDMLLHKVHKVESDESKENSFDSTIDFKCVRCIPITSVYDSDPTFTLHQVSPIIPFPAAEDNRPSDVWIGALMNGQLVDKGCSFERPSETNQSNTSEVADVNISIDPTVLYRRYHRHFAEWLSENRRVVTTDVFLTLPEISDLRLYKKVMICGQTFLIKKISHTFTANSHFVSTRADLIEVPMTIQADDTNVLTVEYSSDGDYENMTFKVVAKYKVTSEITVTIAVLDYESSTLEKDITLVIPTNSTQSEVMEGVPFAIKNISPNEDAVQIYTNGGIKRV